MIGFFLLARLGAAVGHPDVAAFAFSIGALFWAQVFFTLFSSLSTVLAVVGESPQPSVFLFVAPPAAASLAWDAMTRATAAGSGAATAAAARREGLATMNAAAAAAAVAGAAPPPPLTIGRFFFFISAFLLLLVLRLLPLYWRSPFSLVWWAAVFPLCLAGTAWVHTAAEVEAEAPFWVVTTAVVAVATAVAGGVSAATVVAVAQGRLPSCDASLVAYAQSREAQSREEERRADGGGGERGGGRGGEGAPAGV